MSIFVTKYRWEEAIKRAMIGQEDLLSPELPSSPVGNEFPGGRLPLGLSSLTSHLNPRGNTRPRISFICLLNFHGCSCCLALCVKDS